MILYIKQAGCEIFHRGKIVRTPVKLHIKESDIKRYEKMLESKAIRSYDIISDEHTHIHNNLFHIHRKSDKSMNHISTKIGRKKINVVKKAEPTINNTKQTECDTNTMFHDTIENGVDFDIRIDIDSDDILKQLLSNI